MNIPQSNQPRIVIIGGGFAGINLAKKLKNLDVQVVLVDKNNFHTFQPLLYQVATAGLEPDSITYPLRKVFNHFANFYVRIAEAKSVDPNTKVLTTDKGDIHYDYLVVATGARTNYFGNKQIEKYSMPMKTVRQALDLRSVFLQNFEEALITNDIQERERLMNIVIVGGGATGVELAGALAELKKWILPKDYPDLDLRQMKIHLIEGASRVLSAMSNEASDKALEFLKEMGVEIWLNTFVKDYDGEVVSTSTGKSLPSKTLLWAAGVKGFLLDGLSADKSGRLVVDETLKVNGYDSIFSMGDLALVKSENIPNGYPMLASVAMQQGQFLAGNFKRLLADKPPKAFRYKDKGTMATVGRNRAVVDLPNIKFQGRLAWYTWMFVHLVLLVGFRNRVIALINWIWSYINYDNGIRLIIRPFQRKTSRKKESGKVLEPV